MLGIRTFDPVERLTVKRRLARSAPPPDSGRSDLFVPSTDQQPDVTLPATSGDDDGLPELTVRVLDRAECLALLGTAQIGQLVFTYQAMPDVLPVNVALADDVLLIPFADGSTIERAARNTVVAFHVDKIDEATHLAGASPWWAARSSCARVTRWPAVRSTAPGPGCPGVTTACSRSRWNA